MPNPRVLSEEDLDRLVAMYYGPNEPGKDQEAISLALMNSYADLLHSLLVARAEIATLQVTLEVLTMGQQMVLALETARTSLCASSDYQKTPSNRLALERINAALATWYADARPRQPIGRMR